MSDPRSSAAALGRALLSEGGPDAVVLVEGSSDRAALETLARRLGRAIEEEGIWVVPIGGATTLSHYLDPLVSHEGLTLAGMCDVGEEGFFRQALRRAGLGVGTTREDLERSGFFVCVADLEDELIRSLGADRVEQVIESQGELMSFRTLQRQPAHRGRTREEQLHRFMGTRSGRKETYARLMVEALDLSRVPHPLEGVLTRV